MTEPPAEGPAEGPAAARWAAPGAPPPPSSAGSATGGWPPATSPPPGPAFTGAPSATSPTRPAGYGTQAGPAAHQPSWTAALTAHRPGIIPLRPLGFGDILEGSFAALRRNPKAFIGLALLTSLVVLLLFGALGALAYLVATQLGDSASDGLLAAGVVGGFTLVYALTAIVSVALTGILAYPVGEGVLGRRPTAGETWRRTRRMVPRLAGLCLLLMVPTLAVIGGLVALVVLAFANDSNGLGALGVFVIVAALAGVFVVGVRITMSTPALVLEDLGVLASLRRSWALTRGRFWRTFGVLLVAGLLVGVVQQVLGFGFQLVGTVLGLAVGSTLRTDAGDLVSVVTSVAFSVVGALVAAMVCQPFVAAVTALLYTDARIRKEGFDLALVRAATGAGG